ncbi:MAG: TIGR00296 family protein [Thaumarchaeota archaeon]|nr:TIGR00296 family protein [Nitrososphaerota archaeon]
MKDYSNLSDSDGEKLVKTARAVVTEFLKTKNKMKLDKDFEESFSSNAGVFVTLNHKSNLRGCIGYALPDKKLYNALQEAAISAATDDPRFPSVAFEELDQITFEVTVLTPPQEIEVSDPQEYPSKVKVGRDGLIVKSGFNSGLLLPQVPKEYGWNEEEFLDHTCEKAGLPKEQWKEKDTKILKFEGIVFKEQTPGGSVVREKLDF